MPLSERFTEPSALLDVKEVAELLSCSSSHVYRLVNAGKMPAPYKLGALVRWHRPTIEQWICDGCVSPNSGNKNNN